MGFIQINTCFLTYGGGVINALIFCLTHSFAAFGQHRIPILAEGCGIARKCCKDAFIL